MSGGRKTEYKPRAFESKSSVTGARFTTEQGKTRPDTFLSLYESMLLSPAYKALSCKEKYLYTLCKAQYRGKRKPRQDLPNELKLQGDDLFYFNRQLAIEYGFCKENDTGPLYDGLKALEAFGFIDKVVSGKANHQKSIFRYSNRWQTLDKKALGEIAHKLKQERRAKNPQRA